MSWGLVLVSIVSPQAPEPLNDICCRTVATHSDHFSSNSISRQADYEFANNVLSLIPTTLKISNLYAGLSILSHLPCMCKLCPEPQISKSYLELHPD